MEEIPFTGGNLNEMAASLLENFRTRCVDLYADAELLAELKRIRIEEKSYGYRLQANRTVDGHADRATAMVLAMLGAKRSPWRRTQTVIGELVLWP